MFTPKFLLIFAIGVAIAFAIRQYAGPDPDGFSSMQRDVARELPNYGFRDVDVGALSRAKLAEIALLIRGGGSAGEIRGRIGAILERED